jgi:molybdenum cofactor cytidylyltransferase
MLPGAQYAQTEMSGTIGAVILAAGEGRRFGGRKQLAEIDGRSMLEHVIERAAEAGLDPVVAVVPVWLTRPARMVDRRIGWVRNPYPERGMSHSLRLGFAALPATVGAAVILLGDQPTMPRAHIAAVIAARGVRPLVATRVDGHAAPPVLVEASHFDIVRKAEGDEGLRSLLAAHPEWVRQVAIADPALDVDTPGDLEALRDR